MQNTQLVIVGAGPYGLATAAYAKHRGLDVRLFGEPMAFWQRHMPAGMFLRSGTDWHFDACEERTFAAYARERQIPAQELQPIPLARYLDYSQWFQEQYDLHAEPALVRELRHSSERFEVALTSGEVLGAEHVLVAAGFASFVHVPAELASKIPAGRHSHTCDTVDLGAFRGQRCLIVGGRQSAYEWAALLHEHGAAAVHVVHRHDVPRFAPSDWSWVGAMIRRTAEDPGWFRRLPPEQQEDIRRRFWTEGRAKLEPWLWPRIDRENVHRWPGATVADCVESGDGTLRVRLDNGVSLEADHVILATGYHMEIGNLPFLSRERILAHLRVVDGYPVLDEHFQSSIPGLYFTGLPATRDFGPFFGFVAGCPVTAKLVVDRIALAA
jgi:thioredoxin reductase